MRRLLWLCLVLSSAYSELCNVKDFGAKGDGVTLDSVAINKAVAHPSCSIVVFADGKFLTGSIRILKSHKTLYIDETATIIGAPQGKDLYDHYIPNPWHMYQDFGHNHWRDALIYAINVTDITITGKGLINGRKLHGGGPIPQGDGDKLIGLQSCSHVTISNLRLTGSGHFALLATNIDYLNLLNLHVRPHRDGFDIVSCRHVKVYDCNIQFGGDDSLVFKSDFSLGRVLDTYNVHVKNCITGSNGTTGLEFGSETVGDFYDYVIEDHIVTEGGDAAIGMAIMDGSRVHHITYRNITAYNVTSPFQLYIGARGNHPKSVGRRIGQIHDVTFEDIRVHRCFDNYRGRNWTASLDGQGKNTSFKISGEHPVGPQIKFSRVDLAHCSAGGGDPIHIPSPTLPPHEPLHWFKIGPRPSYGFFLRNVVGIQFDQLSLGWLKPDQRPAVFLQNAADVTFTTLSAARGKQVAFDIAIGKNVSGLKIVTSPGITSKHVE